MEKKAGQFLFNLILLWKKVVLGRTGKFRTSNLRTSEPLENRTSNLPNLGLGFRNRTEPSKTEPRTSNMF